MRSGFSSSQNFATAFRQHFGSTPTEFRKSKNANTESKGANALSLRTPYDADSPIFSTVYYQRRNAMNAEVKEMPDFHVAYVRKMGPYGKETCEAAFGELAQWAGPKGLLETSQMLGVYWDNPEVTPPEKCRVDACVVVPEGTETDGAVALQTISAGRYAVCHFEIAGDSFQQAWEDAYKWLVESGMECDDKPCYELYHQCADNHSDGKHVFDICIPLK
jgi:AraC family transcriptional regulator